MNILEEIVESRRQSIAEAKRRVPVEELTRPDYPRRSIRDRILADSRPKLIAELKKASPSAGLLRPRYDPGTVAAAYEAAGAAAISVLTEPNYFMGSPGHLRDVRAAVDLPILRKDFICDSYQLHEAAAWGADIVLLIATVLDTSELSDLYNEALGLGLDVLVEIHGESELPGALACPEALIGVNSRNLTTMKTDLEIARAMAKSIPPDRQCVAESGISTRAEIQKLHSLGYNAFLVGEVLMRDDDPAKRLADLAAP